MLNYSIKRGYLNKEDYCFGKYGFTIPKSDGHKRVLSEQEKNALVKYVPKDQDEQLAKDVWLFSYYCNGMNLSDILRLETDKIKGDSFFFSRKKGRRSDTIVVVLREEVISVC